jgi:molecular chaperone GrpE
MCKEELNEFDETPGAITPEEVAVEETVEAGAPVDELEKLRGELEQEKDKNLRLMADFQNYRRRVSKELAAARIQGIYETLPPFIQVYDYFEMATAAAEKSDNIGAIREGMSMIAREFRKAIDDLSLTRIDSLGKQFDPELHEAVAHESSDAPEGEVIKQWSCGYKMGERLIRPAKVVVSSGPAKESDGEE